MKKADAVLLAVACATCLEWTRLSGTVKIINMKDSTVTIQNRDGDLLTIPIDYQVSIADKKSGDLIGFNRMTLDEKVILTRTVREKPREDSEGLAPPEQPIRGQ